MYKDLIPASDSLGYVARSAAAGSHNSLYLVEELAATPFSTVAELLCVPQAITFFSFFSPELWQC